MNVLKTSLNFVLMANSTFVKKTATTPTMTERTTTITKTPETTTKDGIAMSLLISNNKKCSNC